MPQVFQVLRCYKCLVFQIHQTKKSNKFECKVCGEKQSIKRHYGIGTGKDCRLHVQRLNSARGETEEKSPGLRNCNEDESEDCKTIDNSLENSINCSSKTLKRSKWKEFIDNEVEDTETKSNESMMLSDIQVVTELPQKRKIKKFKSKSKSTKESTEYPNSLVNISNTRFEGELEVPYSNDLKDYESENTIKHLADHKFNNTNLEYPKANQFKFMSQQNFSNKQDSVKAIPKSSKWAQFAEVEDETENCEFTNCELSGNLCKTDNLFTLCDDDDLDNVLDI